MPLINHVGADEVVVDATAKAKYQARVNMVLECLDAGDAEAALRVWRADDSEIILGEAVTFDMLLDALYLPFVGLPPVESFDG